jgi:YVTN family beta-propeller protein
MRTLSLFVVATLTYAVLVSGPQAAPFAYIPNMYSHDVSVIDTAVNRVVTTIAAGTNGAAVAITRDGSRVYIQGLDGLGIIDSATNTVIGSIPVKGYLEGMVVHPLGTPLYVVDQDSSSVFIVDTMTKSVTGSIPLGTRNPIGIDVNHAGTRVYVANAFSNSVSVVDIRANVLIANVAVGEEPVGVAIDPDGGKVYVANRRSGTVSVLDTATNTVVATILVQGGPAFLTVSPNGRRLYVANQYAWRVDVIDTATNAVVARIGVGNSPTGIDIDRGGYRVYVANVFSNTISVIDTALNVVVATVSVGSTPAAVGHFITPEVVTPTPVPTNYQGLWWKAPGGSESGWGINFAHQGDVIFATWYTYDLSGKAWWLSMTANKTVENTYTGTLYRTTGPPLNTSPFDPNRVTRTPVGAGTLTFASARSGTFAYTVNGISQTKAIVPQEFGALPICVWGGQPDLTEAANDQDLWWASPPESESGWGVNFAHQGDTMFATWFTYDVDGTPLWLSATVPNVATRTYGKYTGTLFRTTGPPFSVDLFDPNAVTRTSVGTLTLTFGNDNGNLIGFEYVVTLSGTSSATRYVVITRQVFRPPGTVCRG